MMKSITERYEAAGRLLVQHTRNAVLNGRPDFTWKDGRLFWHRELRIDGAVVRRPVCLDPETGAEKEVFPDPAVIESGREDEPGVTVSPDGRSALLRKGFDLWLRRADGTELRLTKDGEEKVTYGDWLDIYSQVTRRKTGKPVPPQALFSPDGKYFVTYRADLRRVKTLPVIESCGLPEEDLRPRVHTYACPFASDADDEMREVTLYLGDVVSGTLTKLHAPAYTIPVFMSEEKAFARWLPDSSGFWFTWQPRDFCGAKLFFTEAATAETTLRVSETSDRFMNLGAFGLLDGYGSYQFSNFVTSDRRYAFWQSERSGYAHLYRYDAEGNCEGDLFSGDAASLIVQKILRVDEDAKKIYFMANNVPGCSDPLYYCLFVTDFEGRELTRLTPEDGTHSVVLGDRYFTDTWSRIDKAPVSVLRSLDGGFCRMICEADVSELMERGYIIPERFTVPAEDGTELCGILVRPADFDPGKKYPVIDYVYGGAQLYNVPREFTYDNAMGREILGGLESFAQLGFAGVIIDGRGTPGRGKAFHDFSWKRIHICAGLDDHPAAIRALAERYAFLDISRVGIWGNSGGGYATVSALLKYGDLYSTGVASSGNYDQRVYENSWTERYYGPYDPEVYRDGDITRLAGQLRGKLLLACGCMDDNVTIWQTMRLCDQFTRNNRDYDLMVLPRVNHNVPADLYFVRRKMDYFVRWLLKEEPPKEFRFDVMENQDG